MEFTIATLLIAAGLIGFVWGHRVGERKGMARTINELQDPS